MNKSYLKGTLAGFVVLIATVSLIFLSWENPTSNQNIQDKFQAKKIERISIGQTQINVEISDSTSELAKGLSGRESLDEDSGMYFVLGKKRMVNFWMKGMKFPIDIIWIDGNKVVGYVENAQLPTEHDIPTFSSIVPVTNVLEVNAGFVQKHSLKTGDSVTTNN